MEIMDEGRWKAFLGGGTRTAKLATTRSDGRPHVVPVWFVLDDDGAVTFTTGAGSRKGTALRRDPRVCLCVDDETPPYAFVMVEGTARLSQDPAELLAWATRIGGRYMGAQRAGEFGRRNGCAGELLVRVTPTRVVARSGLSD